MIFFLQKTQKTEPKTAYVINNLIWEIELNDLVNWLSLWCAAALELLKTAIEKAGYPDKIIIGMDVAASEFFRAGKYDLDFKSPDDPSRHISGEKLGDLYRSFIKDYPGKLKKTKQGGG